MGGDKKKYVPARDVKPLYNIKSFIMQDEDIKFKLSRQELVDNLRFMAEKIEGLPPNALYSNATQYDLLVILKLLYKILSED